MAAKYAVGSQVKVLRTKKTHTISQVFDGPAQGKPGYHYQLDNGTHYWEYELGMP